MRWGIVGRVRLLRGAVLEKLGRPDDAREQYKLALAQWSQADPDLQVFVQEAQQKLAQLTLNQYRSGADGAPVHVTVYRLLCLGLDVMVAGASALEESPSSIG